MLPEILHGSGYQKQDYEAGIVGAFSHSLLQALNGRNAPNPISFMQHERLFRTGGLFQEGSAPRYLRSDLYLNLSQLRVGSKRLSQYGWRHEVWIEAKFFRNQTGLDGTQHSSNKSAHVGNVLADLIRLCMLVPEPNDTSRSGRYFLHCYDAEPDRYLTLRSRPQLRAIVAPGTQKTSIHLLQNEALTIRNITGNLDDLRIDMNLTNLVLKPVVTGDRPVYYCILTRVDGFACQHTGRNFGVGLDRVVTEREILDEVSALVAS